MRCAITSVSVSELKVIALGLQFGAQLAEILNDAVLYDDDLPGSVGVRMCVALAGLAVGGPARVPDADLALDGRLGQPDRQIAQLPDIAPDGKIAVLHDRDACGVIAAIFQLTQAVHDDLGRIERPRIADDSTHGVLPQQMGSESGLHHLASAPASA